MNILYIYWTGLALFYFDLLWLFF